MSFLLFRRTRFFGILFLFIRSHSFGTPFFYRQVYLSFFTTSTFFDILSFSIESKLSLFSSTNLVEVLKRSVKKPSPFIDFLREDFQKPFFSFKNGFVVTLIHKIYLK